MSKIFKNSLLILSVAVLSVGAFAFVANATHSWGSYHWAITSNPFTLKLGDNVSGSWDSYLSTASNDWSLSNVLNTAVLASGDSRKCNRGTSGRVEVCNKTYGNNGWLGIAQIWVSGTHITKGVVKVNDTYFNTSTYNTSGWRSLVMCQEIGHTLGLDHQDEDFNSPPIEPHTCMDYFVPGASEIVHPNQHDYDQLALIYEHLDLTTTIGTLLPSKGNSADIDLENPSEWGKSLKKDSQGRNNLFVRDLGNGKKVFTHVFWAE